MLFKEIGVKGNPTMILLHGGGLSDWSLQGIVEKLKNEFYIVTPIIDGHGEDGHEEFVSIEDSAMELIEYIDKHLSGKAFILGGLSIGAQIVTEVLSQRKDIAQFAIIESALVYPIKVTALLTVPTYKLFYGLINQRWFAKQQAKALCVPDTMFEKYYQDSLKISKQSLINITLSNGNYKLKNDINKTQSKVLIIVGEKEIPIMKKSAFKLHNAIVGSELYIAPSLKHGELSLKYSDRYIDLIKTFIYKVGE